MTKKGTPSSTSDKVGQREASGKKVDASSARGKKSKRVYIRADPNPIPNVEGLGTTAISWSTAGHSPGWVYVLDWTGKERLFAHAASGRQEAPWISPSDTYRFTLYGDERRKRPMASVEVAMQPGQVGPLRGGRPELNRKPVSDESPRRDLHRRSPDPITTERILAAPLLAQHCRGGSQLIPLAGGHLCLVHESVEFSDGSRVYLHRWLWFDCDWRLAKLSRPFYFQLPSIEFAGGLAARGNKLVISFGVQDRDTWLATVNTREVLALLATPSTAQEETRALRAEAARLPARHAIFPNSASEALAVKWWQPTFQETLDAYDRGDCSQGLSACERLLSAAPLPPVISEQTRRNAVFYAPSLAEIAPSFATRLVTFPVPPGWSRFNPSIAATADGALRMVVRSSNYEHVPHPHYVIHDDQQVTRTTNYLVEVDADLNVVSARPIDDRAFRSEPGPRGTTGFEDCRLVFRSGSWWLSGTVWDHSPGAKAQMALLRLEDTTAVEMYLLTDGIARHEKNWMPVQPSDDGELFFIYSCFPTVLIKFDEESAQRRSPR